MLNRIIRIIGTAACCTLLLAGCSLRLDDPVPNREPNTGEAIGFSAGSTLLLDDAQTKANLTDSFEEDSTFVVFGNRVVGGVQSPVFDGVTVTYRSSVWTYSPLRLWRWESSGDWYDFAAVSPAGQGTAKMDLAGNIAISTSYDITRKNYDLMGATYRRTGNVLNPNDAVALRFNHLTSAVRIRVINNSEATGVTVDSVRFTNLVVVGDAKVTLNNFGYPEMSWINTERNTAIVRKSCPEEDVAAGDSYYSSWDFMIPQRLDQKASMNDADVPKLRLYYTPDGDPQKYEDITLKDVCPRDSSTPITDWVIGSKYTYEISMRLDGGVLVSIVTTDWGEPIEAETPGLLII